jgi:hypothetical protein
VQQELRDHKEQLDLQDLQELRDHKEQLDLQDHRELQAKRDLRVF